MSGERTVPLLPCRSVDEIAGFYTMLGFTRTYRQERPNAYVVMERDDLHLHFFGMPGFRPEDSYGSCLVVVPDIVELFDAFAARMRAAHGKLLVSGIPRMTRPRRRKNAEGVTGFAVIDPGGNWIRFTAGADDAPAGPAPGGLTGALHNAVVMGDSRGDHERAARLLDHALRRHEATAGPAELVEALAYRAELAARAEDAPGVREFVARAEQVPLDEAGRRASAGTLTALRDLAAPFSARPVPVRPAD
ncbi:VOC family protein [Streptomyces albidoflavus]|uniref:VOC family protein n=1 Tax=Streptomyces albidoflavus TaxID=1886 RepID=UPI003091AE9F|nr:VOC family protein [Streptomyces albidoflavus]WTD95306.1 VOC family protein [Streptomyces albidoflavus]